MQIELSIRQCTFLIGVLNAMMAAERAMFCDSLIDLDELRNTIGDQMDSAVVEADAWVSLDERIYDSVAAVHYHAVSVNSAHDLKSGRSGAIYRSDGNPFWGYRPDKDIEFVNGRKNLPVADDEGAGWKSTKDAQTGLASIFSRP